VANDPAVPQSDDSIIMSAGDAQFTGVPIPGVDNGTQGGTVFWTGGQIDMINSGGFNGILANTLVQVTDTVAATATLTSQGGSTIAGTLDVDTNGTLAFSLVSGTATNTGIIEALNGGTLTISGAGTLANTGTVVADAGGLIVVSAAVSGTTSYWSMGPTSGGAVEINTPIASSLSNVFDFQSFGTLKLDQLATFGGNIFEPGGGDVVDIGANNVGTVVVASTGSGNTVSVLLEGTAGGSLGSFFLTPFGAEIFQTGTFVGNSDPDIQFNPGTGGDTIMTLQSEVACFAAGTPIATERGEVAVEDLQVGDRVRTVIGGRLEPIVWVGHRTIDCSRHPNPKQVWPVRVAAGTFGRGKPSHDVFLSPDHAVYVEGVLIPVKHLINGSSITQVPRVSVTYYHVQLAQHDVVLAGGLPAESYLAEADLGVFAHRDGAIALYPDMSARVWEAEGCAPLVVTGPEFEAARRSVRLPARPAARQRRSRAA